MLCSLLKTSSFLLFCFHCCFQLQIIWPTYRGRVHLLSHNVRYNTDTNWLTFHVLEKDWKALPSSTVVVISNMLTRDSSAPIPITSSATTVTPVDIKKVYGLEQGPSVVRMETKSDVLEVTRTWYVWYRSNPAGVLPSKRLLVLGMCRWMGSHFHN